MSDTAVLVRFRPLEREAYVLPGTRLVEAAACAGIVLDVPCGGQGLCGKCRVRIISGARAAGSSSATGSASARAAGSASASATGSASASATGSASASAAGSASARATGSASARATGSASARATGSASAAPPTAVERDWFSDEQLRAGWRLACQTAVAGPLDVEVPGDSQAAETFVSGASASSAGRQHQILVDAAEMARPTGDPTVRKRYVELPPPVRGDDAPDALRLERALSDGPLEIGLPMLRELPAALREAEFRGTAVLAERRLLDFERGDTASDGFAAAFDLGTTTLVGLLLDLRTGDQRAVTSRLNPQTRFGDDVLSRILHARERDDGLSELHAAIVTAVDEMIGELCQLAGAARHRIYELAVAGNTTMQQVFCGVDPSPLGETPFVPAAGAGLACSARELGLHIHPRGGAYVMPAIGGFVGGDAVAGILATGLAEMEGPSLLIDVGTNGEIVLLADGNLSAASTAAGPAFEGARISCGMRGATGAIEKVVFELPAPAGGTEAGGGVVRRIANPSYGPPPACGRGAGGPDLPSPDCGRGAGGPDLPSPDCGRWAGGPDLPSPDCGKGAGGPDLPSPDCGRGAGGPDLPSPVCGRGAGGPDLPSPVCGRGAGGEGRVHINVIGGVPPVGLCGSGLIDVVAELLRHGMLTPQGRLQVPAAGGRTDWQSVVQQGSGVGGQGSGAEPDTHPSSFTIHHSPEIVLTQRDIREVQLATGAIRAGTEILLRRCGLRPADLQQVLVGGGFGNFIRRSNAQRMGLLPHQVERHRIRYMGNTSLAGARLAALSRDARRTAERLARCTEHVDLSADPAFYRAFAEAMIFPES